MKTSDKLFLVIGLIAIISATGVGGYAFINSASSSTKTPQIVKTVTPSASNTTTAPTTSATISGYNDGVYTQSSSYSVPHSLSNSIEVSITIKDGVIAAASTKHTYTDNESGSYIDAFDSSLASTVVGKPIGTTSFSRIGGASLTTDGFQRALELVQNAARI